MATSDLIQIIGIIIATIIGIISLCLGVNNQKKIKIINKTISNTEINRILSQKSIAKNSSKSIQVGGDVTQWTK